MEAANAQIGPLLHIVRAVLGEDLLAAYLYGSCVMGGLRPDSDLDVMAVGGRPARTAEKRALVTGLLEISMDPRPIELTIVVESEVRPWRYPPRRDFQYGEWWRSEYERGNFEPWTSDTDPDLASLIRMVMKANEVLEGPPAQTMFEPVPRRDYVRSLVDGTDGLLADLEGDERNVILTLSRIWYSLATDEIRSKDAAAEWAIDRLPADHRSLLAEARAGYLGGEAMRSEGLTTRARDFAHYLMVRITDLASTELDR